YRAVALGPEQRGEHREHADRHRDREERHDGLTDDGVQLVADLDGKDRGVHAATTSWDCWVVMAMTACSSVAPSTRRSLRVGSAASRAWTVASVLALAARIRPSTTATSSTPGSARSSWSRSAVRAVTV